MQKYIKCHIPSAIKDWNSPEGGASISEKFKTALKVAMDLQPSALPDEVERLAVDMHELDGALRTRLAQLVDEKKVAPGCAPGRLAGMLVQSYLTTLNAPAKKDATPIAPGIAALRPEQIRLHDEFMSYAKDNRIVAVEAGTGIGKSRIIATAAISLLRMRDAGHDFHVPEHEQRVAPQYLREKMDSMRANSAAMEVGQSIRPVVIAAPTVATMMHLAREYEAVNTGEFKTSLLIGRQQFASAQAIAELLENHPCEPVSQWLSQGMPSGQCQATMGIPIHGLMEDLRSITSGLDFPTLDCAIAANSPDDDAIEYQKIRDGAWNADVIFTTHAMVALSTKLVGSDVVPPLPRPFALLIDEAHALEDSFAACSSASASMTRLAGTLREDDWGKLGLKTSAKECLAHLRIAYIAMQAMPAEVTLPFHPRNTIETDRWNTVNRRVRELAKALKTFQAAAKANKTPSFSRRIRHIEEAADAMDKALDGYSGRLEFSPTKRYPSLQIGVKSVRAALQHNWEATPVVGLFSGTLFAPGDSEGTAINSLGWDLSIPTPRLSMTSRAHPSWLFNTATLYLPKPNSAPILPNGEEISTADLARWADDVAARVSTIAEDAAGGTLILCTGYSRTAAVASALKRQLGGRVIEQKPLFGVDGMVREFRAASRKGTRPIAVATGGAWTGLDLSDSSVEAENDLLLTDLVITAVPFNVNRSAVHISKVERYGQIIEINHAIKRLTQGIGRLIRRPGVKDRRLWILDARLERPNSKPYSRRFLSVLSRYIKKAYY